MGEPLSLLTPVLVWLPPKLTLSSNRMPELPEVEVLVRRLQPLLVGQVVSSVQVRRLKVLGNTSLGELRRAVVGARFGGVRRRGKYLLFELVPARPGPPRLLVGHLGMTGRMYVAPSSAPLAKHAAVVLGLGQRRFIFEDTRYFGRLSFSCGPIEKLGPEPLEPGFTADEFYEHLKRSRQAIKTRLLDQRVVAGVGNIYASEALFRARLSPRLRACRITRPQARRLWSAVRAVLRVAIRFGSTVPLSLSGDGSDNRLFYYGTAAGQGDFYTERLRVYDRAGRPCPRCSSAIRRIVQGGRSTFYCPNCQRG